MKSYKNIQLQLSVEYFPIEGCKPWELLIKIDTGMEDTLDFSYAGSAKDLTQSQILNYIKSSLENSYGVLTCEN